MIRTAARRFACQAALLCALAAAQLPPAAFAQADAGGPGSLQLWSVALAGAGLTAAYVLGLRWLRLRAAAQDRPERPPGGVFSPVELDRYARHIMLREIGGEGQRKLKRTRIAVVGAGGLGSPALLYLAAAGVGRITVIDDDRVELSNLQRQIIHSDQRIGQRKAESAARSILSLNPHTEVSAVARRLEEDSADLLSGHDIVLDGSDSFETRALVNRTCAARGIPLVSGAISQWEGQVTVSDPAAGSPCLECLFPARPAEDAAPSCAEAGVMGALPGIIGSLMAAEAIKIAAGAGRPLRGEMLIYDALWGETRMIKYDPRDDCRACGADARAAGRFAAGASGGNADSGRGKRSSAGSSGGSGRSGT